MKRETEWVPRARHHAKSLLKLAQVASDIIESKVTRWRPTTRGVHIKTNKGVYIVSPIHLKDKRYAGIQVRKAGKCLVQLMVLEEGA